VGATRPDRPLAAAEDRVGGGHASHWDNPGRATGFSDAVFAIIITLLVLDLPPPEGEPGHMLADLLAQWPAYLAYVASYLTVGVIWTNHRAAFHHIRRMNWGLYWLNLGVLFGTGLLPFPTAMVARSFGAGDLADERTAVGLYVVIGLLTTLSWVLFWQYLSSHRELLAHAEDPAFFARERTRALVGAAVYSGAGVLGVLLTPKLALAVFVLAPIFYALTSEGLPRWPRSKGRSWTTRI
jgi:uncharacterized membrane protein